MLAACRDLAVEAAWRFTPRRSAVRRPSWPLDARWLGSTHVVWPSRYQWPLMGKWVEPLRRGFARFVDVVVEDFPQPFEGVVLLRVVTAHGSWTVAIDCFDKATLNERCAASADVYFKMQYQQEGYRWSHVLPGGYGPADYRVHRFLPRLRALADRAPLYDVYGRFGLQFASAIRRDAIGRLRESGDVRYEGGAGIVRYSRFLREVARAKVCINLPGNGDLCFRLIDYLAVGACVIGPPLKNSLHVPLEDGVHVVYTKDDLSDLVPLCRRYVEDAAARETIRSNARRLFDNYLASDQLAAYYLYCCEERLRRSIVTGAAVP